MLTEHRRLGNYLLCKFMIYTDRPLFAWVKGHYMAGQWFWVDWTV